MGAIFSYTLVSGLVLLAMYLIYKWMLAGEKQYAFNRAALWGIYLLAWLAPAVQPGLRMLRQTAQAPVAAGGWVEIGDLEVGPVIEDVPLLPHVMLWVYVAGVGVSLLFTVMTALRLRSVIRSGRKEKCGRYTLVVTPGESLAPFSWFRYIVMSEKDWTASGSVIMTHETRHLDCAHWMDMLTAQAVCVLQWFNPAAWLMREELKAVHEYQADEAVLASGADPRSYQMLLIKKAVGARFPSIANSLNHSKLKKRVTMMYKSNSSVAGRLRALALIPAGALALLAVQVPAVASAIESASEATLTVAGGKDSKSSASVKTDQPVKAATLDDVVVVGYGSAVVKSPEGKENADNQSLTVIAVNGGKKTDGNRTSSEVAKLSGDTRYLIDGREVSQTELAAMPADEIASIDVFKDSNPAQVKITTKTAAAAKQTSGGGSASDAPVKVAEVMPVFPGGLNEMMKYVAMNVRYPEAAMKANKEGRVVVQFVVAKDGTVESPEIIRSISPELDAEAIRVVKSMPAWTPGSVDGKPVACYFTLPVQFRLQRDPEPTTDAK